MSFEEIERVDPALTAQRDAAKARGDSAEAVRLEAAMEASMRATWKPIAQIGRVPTKVDGSYGAIKAGDYLTSSPTPGHAMKMTEPGMALGVALEDFDSTGKGTLSVFVRPTWHGAPIEQKRLTALERENAELKGRLDALEAMMQSKFTAR